MLVGLVMIELLVVKMVVELFDVEVPRATVEVLEVIVEDVEVVVE